MTSYPIDNLIKILKYSMDNLPKLPNFSPDDLPGILIEDKTREFEKTGIQDNIKVVI